MRYFWLELSIAALAGVALGLLLCGTGHAEGPVRYSCDPHSGECRCFLEERLVSCLPSENHHGDVFVKTPSTLELCSVYHDGTLTSMPCDEAWILRTDAEPPCLAQMETAMRAMDEFIAHGLWPIEESQIPGQSKALVLWHEAKRDCWRTK